MNPPAPTISTLLFDFSEVDVMIAKVIKNYYICRMKKFICCLAAFLMFFTSSAIVVKIENPRINVDAKNNVGNPVISASCKLKVDGIKGKDFDLVAIVKDDKGQWHTSPGGSTVKTHYGCNATYEQSVWNDISVYIRHDKLYPKPGKHSYEVYLYVYYDGNWYGGTKAGSYNQTGASSSSSSSSYASNRSSSSSSSDYETVTCKSCNGTGKSMCLGGCLGTGVIKTVQNTGYPYYSTYLVDTRCGRCNGSGKQNCLVCGGKGSITYKKNNYTGGTASYGGGYTGGGYYSPGTSSSSSSSSSSSRSSSAYTTCRICHGSGVCTSCGGTGGSWKDTGYYTGSNTKSWINCGSCHGNKRCFNCHGTGRQ